MSAVTLLTPGGPHVLRAVESAQVLNTLDYTGPPGTKRPARQRFAIAFRLCVVEQRIGKLVSKLTL